MGEQVLVYVDDEPALCRLFEALMSALGPWKIVTFSEAPLALQYLEQNSVDVLLCDYRMPKMTGIELIDRLSDCPPCLLVTGDHSLDGVELDDRVRGVVRKPFRYADLAKRVEELLA